MKKIIYLFTLLPIIGFCQDNYTDYNKIISEIKILKGDDDKDKDKKVISGDPEKIKKINDTWVFSRDIS